MNPPTIHYLSDITFQAGALGILPQLLHKLGITKPLVVSDAGLVSLGMVERMGIGRPPVFDQVEANPTEANAAAGREVFREHGCDGIVAVGGGSPLDCAKCIGLLVHHPPPLSQYAFIHGGLSQITPRKPPLIAIPTTAGTGSEVGRAALVSTSNGRKLAIISPQVIPNAVICDPTLTLGMPKALTAGTGMDAIAHCVETYCSPRFNPVADAIALDGLARACANIHEAVNHGENLAARSEMMMAALQGGLTFQKGLGLVHSLSHPLGGLQKRRLHHGTLNAIFLPHVLRFNWEACPEKMARMAEAAGVASASALPAFFASLAAELGLPGRLRDLGMAREDFESMPEFAVQDHCSQTNPRGVTGEVCQQIYDEAF